MAGVTPPRAVPKLTGPTPLKAGHIITGFNSKKPVMNTWLQKNALANAENDFTKTFVACRGRKVIGYYSLASGGVDKADAQGMIAGSNAPAIIPVTILARLAVDQSEEDKGIGSALLADAMKRAASASRTIASRALVLHALDADVAKYYVKHNFQKLHPDDPKDMTYFMSMKAIRDAL